ncbi:MAG: cobyric acid synthase CobQ [Pseudonocardiales bacterium]|nr:MAG: cobyric acid synthase CobQ [Pseudonocardiales bacterium]
MSNRAGGLLVCGTASNAGKTTLVAGLCRALARRGVGVAPFKAQNMSLNSGVTPDGHEIARAQLLQAEAAGTVPHGSMNPILIKPGSDRRSHLIVNGLPAGDLDARSYLQQRRQLLDVVVAAYEDLASRSDVIIAEGAGSPAEMNLREHDIVNLGFAHAVDLPVILVADIDRGGAFASLIGTLACLDDADRARIRGFVINRFRGDPHVLAPGLDELTRRTGLPVYGVLPYDPALQLDAEDSLSTNWAPTPAPPLGPDILRITVIRFPRASNLTDFEPLAAEPGVVLTFADVPQQILDADLVVLPGTRSTVDDLNWLRTTGFPEPLRERADQRLPILGICGGYQMLGEHISDDVESRAGTVEALGILPVTTRFTPAKTVRCVSARLPDGTQVTGYQLHHGHVTRHGGAELLPGEGCRHANTYGTTWHGLLDSDAYRRALLTKVAAAADRIFTTSDLRWHDERHQRLDRLGDLIERHVDPGLLAQFASRQPTT